MMPVPVLPVGGKAPVVILVVLGVLAVAMLVNRPSINSTQPLR